jgi:CHASE2 domain-containing sensor protein
MIRLSEQTSRSLKNSPKFTFISIDDATYSAWGAHQVTPRARLKTIVERVARSDPTAILLDVDLSFSDSDDASGEAVLRDFLGQYPGSAPPLLLVRPLYHNAPPPALPRLRLTSYDEQTATKPNIIWGSPLFERDADGLVRRWQLFVQVCAGDHPAVLPALHLAAAMIARAKIGGFEDPEQAAARIPERLARFGSDSCDRPTARSGEIVGKKGDLPAISIDRLDVSSRVLYRAAWRADQIALGGDVSSSDGQAPFVAVRPASLAFSGDLTSPIPGLAGKIVVIGGSFADSGDWYQTPLGRMPGALLLINAVEALTVDGTPREPSVTESVVISIVIIVMSSIRAAFFRPIVAASLAAVGIFLIMLVTLPSFQSGVVFNLAVPAVGATVYDLCATLVEKYHLVRELGWRFVLKQPAATIDQETMVAPVELTEASGDSVGEVT